MYWVGLGQNKKKTEVTMLKWERPALIDLSTRDVVRGDCLPVGTGHSAYCSKGIQAGGGLSCQSGSGDALCEVGTGQQPGCTPGSLR